MSAPLAVVVQFERLPCPGIGCYGNEWVDTPTFDALAADGIVCDAHLANELRASTEAQNPPRLPAGITVHDLCEVDFANADDFTAQPAAEWPFARLIRSAVDRLKRAPDAPFVLHLHAAGLTDPAGVPSELADLYADEMLELGVDWTGLSESEKSRHPGTLAAAVTFIDAWLGELWTALQPISQQRPLLVSISASEGALWHAPPRRFAIPGGLESQRIRAPWLVWTNTLPSAAAPDPSTPWSGAGTRLQALTQPVDLPPTLAEWFGLPEKSAEGISLWPLVRSEEHAGRSHAVIRGLDDAHAIWTPADLTISHGSEVRFFRKPEDLWDVNDVAEQADDAVQQRLAMLPEV